MTNTQNSDTQFCIDTNYFQNQLSQAGISVTELNIANYKNLPPKELQKIVKAAKLAKYQQTQALKLA